MSFAEEDSFLQSQKVWKCDTHQQQNETQRKSKKLLPFSKDLKNKKKHPDFNLKTWYGTFFCFPFLGFFNVKYFFKLKKKKKKKMKQD